MQHSKLVSQYGGFEVCGRLGEWLVGFDDVVHGNTSMLVDEDSPQLAVCQSQGSRRSVRH
jgi:hypothetical protein